MTTLWDIWWFVIGTFVGSFLNVCIYRIPREESIVRPRSRCPHCRHPIAWYDNVPLLSYLLLRAQCRHCRKPIHWRYPLVEVVTGAFTAWTFQRFGHTPPAAVYAAFVWALIAASAIDFEHQIIPDEISLGGLAVGLILSPLLPQLHGTSQPLVALGRSAIGALAGGGSLYVTGVLGTWVFRKEAMGGGDVKLLAMAGSLLGWKLVTLTFFLAPVLAIGPGLAVLFTKKSHVIPYGPFLSMALVVSLFAGQQILNWTGVEDTIRILSMYYGRGH